VCDAKIGIDRWKAHQIPPPVRDHHVRGPLPRSQQIVLTFNIAAVVSWASRSKSSARITSGLCDSIPVPVARWHMGKRKNQQTHRSYSGWLAGS
jgi:hypothetical protein